MKASDKAYELIKHYEGLSLAAYPDPGTGGFPFTIGYGRAYGVNSGDVITITQADEYLREDVQKTERQVQGLLFKDVTQNQFDALVVFAYNVGAGNLKTSTLLRMINEGNASLASPQFLRWDMAAGHHMKGLLNRRTAEKDLFDA